MAPKITYRMALMAGVNRDAPTKLRIWLSSAAIISPQISPVTELNICPMGMPSMRCSSRRPQSTQLRIIRLLSRKPISAPRAQTDIYTITSACTGT